MRNKITNVFIQEDTLLLGAFWKNNFNVELTDRLSKQS